jgi:hypothetical protein
MPPPRSAKMQVSGGGPDIAGSGCSSSSYTPVHRSQHWALELRGDGLRTLANRLGSISSAGPGFESQPPHSPKLQARACDLRKCLSFVILPVNRVCGRMEPWAAKCRSLCHATLSTWSRCSRPLQGGHRPGSSSPRCRGSHHPHSRLTAMQWRPAVWLDVSGAWWDVRGLGPTGCSPHPRSWPWHHLLGWVASRPPPFASA